MNAIHIHPNILAPHLGWHRYADVAGWTLHEVIREFRHPEWGNSVIYAAVNGRAHRGDMLDLTVKPGDDVILAPDIFGFEIAALVGLTGFLAVAAGVGINIALGIGLNYAIAALQPKPKLRRTAAEDGESPTYNLADGIQTTYGPGFRLGVPYGSLRLGGQVLSQNFASVGVGDETSTLLVALGLGPLAKIAGVDMTARQEWNNFGGLRGQLYQRPEVTSGIRVNGVALAREDSMVHLRAGTLYQTPVPGFTRGSTVYAVGKPLRASRPVTYAITPSAKFLRARIRFDALFTQTGGGIFSHTVAFGMRQLNAQGQQVGFFSGGFSTEARRSPFTFNLEAAVEPTAVTWEITRSTPDDLLTTSSSCAWAQTVEEFESAEIAYPQCALLGLEFRASEQFTGSEVGVTVPVWGKILQWRNGGAFQTPAFYHAASGLFPGRNPAWVAYDWLTQPYGLGLFLTASDIHLPSFDEFAEYSEVPVPDGHGGIHPRNRCDMMVDGNRGAWDTFLDILRTGQAVPWHNGNRITIKYAHPHSVSFPNPVRFMISEANCPDMAFAYKTTRGRPTIFDAQILDEELDFEANEISVRDPGALFVNEPWRIGHEPPIREGRDLPGIVRAQQVKRDLIYEHAVNRLRTLEVTGTVGLDVFAAEPRDLIAIQSDIPRWFGGNTFGYRTSRAGTATTDIYLDHQVVLAAATVYQVMILQVETVLGVPIDGIPKLYNITAAAGTYPPDTAIALAASVTYGKGRQVLFGQENKVRKEFEIISFELQENLQVKFRALIWDEEVFSQPVPLGEDNSLAPTAPFQDTDLPVISSVAAVTTADGGSVALAWEFPSTRRGPARVYVRKLGATNMAMGDAGWRIIYEGDDSEVILDTLKRFQAYEVSVVLRDKDGRWGSPGQLIFEVTPEEFPPVPALQVIA